MSTFVCWHQPVLVAPLTRSDCSACTLGSASALAGSYLQRRCPELPHRSACSRWSRCPGRESNPHALSGGSLSDFCVYQFHHLGKKSGEGRIRTYNLLVCSVRVGPGEGTRGHERWVALKAGFFRPVRHPIAPPPRSAQGGTRTRTPLSQDQHLKLASLPKFLHLSRCATGGDRTLTSVRTAASETTASTEIPPRWQVDPAPDGERSWGRENQVVNDLPPKRDFGEGAEPYRKRGR